MEYLQFKLGNMVYYMSNRFFYEMSDKMLQTQCFTNLPLYFTAYQLNICSSFSFFFILLGLFVLEKKFIMLSQVKEHAHQLQKKQNNNALENYLFK